MPDMLVKLLELPPIEPIIAQQKEQGVIIRRGMPPEKHFVIDWIRQNFSMYWVSEAEKAYTLAPATIYIAIENRKVVGFACYDTTYKGFFGPTGVDESVRGRGIGGALLIATLHGLLQSGYAYGIIGGAGPVDFYRKVIGATVIEGTEHPGSYRGMLGLDYDE